VMLVACCWCWSGGVGVDGERAAVPGGGRVGRRSRQGHPARRCRLQRRLSLFACAQLRARAPPLRRQVDAGPHPYPNPNPIPMSATPPSRVSSFPTSMSATARVQRHVSRYMVTVRSVTNRYAARCNMTDVVVTHLPTDKTVRIRCRDYVKKVGLFKLRLSTRGH
jgi:hypothetical protein